MVKSRPFSHVHAKRMNLKESVFWLASLMLGSLMGNEALARNIPPIAIELGATPSGRLDDSAPRRPTNHAFACYALNTKPGDEVSIRVHSSAFDPVLEVARGALCTAAALQFENDNVDETTKDAVISFRAAGGRYLIFVRGSSPASRGDYQLKLEPGLDTSAKKQTPASDDAQRRRQIMAMEIEKRNAELAAAEAKRQAELAAARAQRAALLAQEQEARRYEQYESDYEEEPTKNPMAVFADTLLNELAAQHQQQEAFRRQQAARREQAEYQRRMAAERAQEAQQDQAMRQAAAQRAQAAQAQQVAAERAHAAAEASRRVASAQRTSDRVVAYPAGGQRSANSFSQNERASTRNDPATCVSGPELVKNPNCPNGAGSRVRNQCAHAIDARICHWTTRDRWDCGITSVSPGSTGGYPSCSGTGRLWMQVQYSDSRTKFSDPP